MIDNVKMYIIQKDNFEHLMMAESKVDLKTSTSLLTYKTDKYPQKGKLDNLEVVINEKRAYINGSLHKLENILTDDGEQNYDDFTFCQLRSTIEEMLRYFNCHRGTSLSQLELGLNLHIAANPKHFLDFNLLMHNYRDHNKNLKFRGKGDYKEFQKTDYYLKIYNKSKPYKINANILRVEIKIISKRLLQKLGVFCIEDLLKEAVLYNIFSLLLNEIKKCTIIDTFNAQTIERKDLEKLYCYTNPNYWNTVRETKSEKIQTSLKKDFERVATKYSLLKTKHTLLKLMIEKFWQLMDCPQSHSSIMSIAA